MNKAFYLLAEGGRHSFSGVTVTGIGRRSAEQIFYRTLTTKLSPTANFAEIARGTLSAAADLFGANSNQYRATEQAWTAVGVLGSSNQTPCFNCEAYQGKLYGPGDADIQPNDTYYYSAFPGRQQGWLLGPEGTDFDLYLFRWNGWQWVKVASSEGEESVEEIVYNGPPGYYMWQISCFSGRGSYQFWLQRP